MYTGDGSTRKEDLILDRIQKKLAQTETRIMDPGVIEFLMSQKIDE